MASEPVPEVGEPFSGSCPVAFHRWLGKLHKRLSEPFTESREPFIGAVSRDYIKHKRLQLKHLWILNHRIQIIQETPEESYYRRNLGRVRRVNTVDKTMEPSGDGGPVWTSQSFSNQKHDLSYKYETYAQQ